MNNSSEVRRLTKEAFQPFGTVLEMDGAEVRMINSGTCTRFHALCGVQALGDDALTVVSLFHAQPFTRPLRLAMMERHPLGSQAFWPLAGEDWLVAVAPDVDGQPGPPSVFRATGRQGVCYGPNVWHHPLLVLGGTSDFLVVDRDGPGINLEEAYYATPHDIRGL